MPVEAWTGWEEEEVEGFFTKIRASAANHKPHRMIDVQAVTSVLASWGSASYKGSGSSAELLDPGGASFRLPHHLVGEQARL